MACSSRFARSWATTVRLSGDVEVDESAFGGKPRARTLREWDAERYAKNRRSAAARWAAENKTTVFAMVERGGRVRTMVVPNRSQPVLHSAIRSHVLSDSMIFSDEWALYEGISKGYRGHRRIKHKARIYVEGDVHTNTVEGFFGLVKTGIRGVYHAVSVRYLPDYLNEYAFRYNRRKDERPMFWAILDRVQKGLLPVP
ncbi:MAG: IS1595 family transposase [Actinomycetota bacterium]|nr:IS1595 family transposase [Actinomycetota bacterium]